MKGESVIVIGAGLTGLNVARLLEQRGLNVTILEARDRLGGRIYTKESFNHTKIEMGATWLGPQHTQLMRLLEKLGIEIFEQYMKGSSFFQPFSTSPPQAVDLPAQHPNYRIQGGTHTLIESLRKTLQKTTIHLNTPVLKLDFNASMVLVTTSDGVYKADKVISTLPPALLIHSIDLQPTLPDEVIEVMKNTQTWMRDSIKAGVVFQSAFWRAKNQSGTLFSNVGPLNESYDHTSNDNARFAMKGFINPAFSTLPPEERKANVIAQLISAFGAEAQKFSGYEELVWSNEKYTKGKDDSDLFPHQNNGHAIYQRTYHEGRLVLAGAETSPQFGGYMEGAVQSSVRVVEKIIQQ